MISYANDLKEKITQYEIQLMEQTFLYIIMKCYGR